MRFDKPIFFQSITRGEYDDTTGDYLPDTVKETKKYADITDAGVETLRLIYGELKQGVLTVRIQNHIDEPFDKIRIGRKLYNVDFMRVLSTKQVFVVSEVQK